MIPEKSGILKHAIHNDSRTDDEAEFIYQRSAEKAQAVAAANNRVKADTSRMAAPNLKQQPPTATAGAQPGGLAAAMNNASKQEVMMPGHRLRERAGR